MKTDRNRTMTNSQRATLARTRIASACHGEQTSEFREWRKRTQVIAAEYRSGKRDRRVENKAAARQYAWIAAEQEFAEKHPERAGELVGFSTKDAEAPTTLAEEVRWAYRNASVYSVTEADAPSPGAWLWLQEARANRSQFLGKVFALEQATHAGKLPKQSDEDAAKDLGINIDKLLGYSDEGSGSD